MTHYDFIFLMLESNLELQFRDKEHGLKLLHCVTSQMLRESKVSNIMCISKYSI